MPIDCVAEPESLLDLPALHNRELRPRPASDRPQDLRGREVTAEAAQAYGEDNVIMMMCDNDDVMTMWYR